MHHAQLGDRVRVAIRWIPLGNNEETLREYTVGSNDVPPSLSLGVVGLAQGEKKQITVSANDAMLAGHVPADTGSDDAMALELTLVTLDRSPFANASRPQFDLGGEA
jgi:Holliday junction resolvasome RuvABC endonuclease subunit